MSSILPKNELENFNFCPSLLGQKFLVHFLGELKKTKCHFEINWPLFLRGATVLNTVVYTSEGLLRQLKTPSLACIRCNWSRQDLLSFSHIFAKKTNKCWPSNYKFNNRIDVIEKKIMLKNDKIFRQELRRYRIGIQIK